MYTNREFLRPSRYFLYVATLMVLAWPSSILAKESDREELLSEIRELSSLELLVAYQDSQMMLQYAELAQHGIKIQTPQGTLSKRKAKKLVGEHQLRIELCEQVIGERGINNLEGEYEFLAAGDCEAAQAWWAVVGGNNSSCGDLVIHQDEMNITVTQPCELEGDKFDLENTGLTIDNAIMIVEEVNSDYQYIGTVHGGVISLRVNADRALAAWPSFQKPPGKKAINGCQITLKPK